MAERTVLVSIVKISLGFLTIALFGERRQTTKSGTSSKSCKEGVGLAVQVNV
jgi:hypothetical protein